MDLLNNVMNIFEATILNLKLYKMDGEMDCNPFQ